MPRNGSGTYSRSTGIYSGTTSWAQTRDAPRKIRADDHDTHDQDIADALTASLTKDGQTTPTANLPMGGFLHTNVADATARTNYAKVSQVQDTGYVWGGTTGGSSTVYTMSVTPAVTAYVAGLVIRGKMHVTCGAAPTINVNAVGAKTIKKLDGRALFAGELIVNALIELIYDGADFILISQQNLQKLGSFVAQSISGTASGTSITYTGITEIAFPVDVVAAYMVAVFPASISSGSFLYTLFKNGLTTSQSGNATTGLVSTTAIGIINYTQGQSMAITWASTALVGPSTASIEVWGH